MLEVYHYPLCPFSRKLRIVLREKNIPFEMFIEPYFMRRKEFLKLNPSGETPMIVRLDKRVMWGNQSIFEYLEELPDVKRVYPEDLDIRAESRKITEWFDNKFFNEVTRYILNEKIIKTVSGNLAPNSQAIQAAKKNINMHLDYIGYLRKNQRYLVSDEPTLADFSAAAQLSVLDFVGDVPWNYNQSAKEWYALIKSRPSFKPILFDKIANFTPPVYYSNPDF